MNTIEIKYLTQSKLSHISRSLYTFFLRKNIEQNEDIIDLVAITAYLFSDSSYFKTVPNLEIAEKCLNELEEAGLIRKDSEHWQGAKITLPYYADAEQNAPKELFAMDLKWVPSSNFKSTALICGLEDISYTPSQLQAFRTYWTGRSEARNQNAWERAFAIRLLKAHEDKSYRKKETKLNALENPTQIIHKTPLITEDQMQKDLDEMNALFKK